jgi:hypothetical protein
LNQPYLYLTVKTIISRCNESFNICSINWLGTGVGRKSLVVLRDEMNSETQAPSSWAV